MARRMPVPLVPGKRGRAVLDAELPPLSQEELEELLRLVGGEEPCVKWVDGVCCDRCSASQ